MLVVVLLLEGDCVKGQNVGSRRLSAAYARLPVHYDYRPPYLVCPLR